MFKWLQSRRGTRNPDMVSEPPEVERDSGEEEYESHEEDEREVGPSGMTRAKTDGIGPLRGITGDTPDHHCEYLAKAVAALTPEGRKRVDELLDELAIAGRSREWVVRFAMAREAEVEAGRMDTSQADEPGQRLNEQELDGLTAGFMTIRDQEPLDDVTDWANAVLALLADERALSNTS